MQITIESSESNKVIFEEYEANTGNHVDYISKDELLGGEIISFILALTASTAPFITKIIIQILKNKKGAVSINFNGKKITNLTEETAERIVEKLLEHEVENGIS